MSAVPILRIENVTKDFQIKRSALSGENLTLRAVNDVSLDVYPGETLGVVGESGCGKSTLGRTILQLTRPTQGRILFDGNDITRLSRKQLKAIRQDIQIIFQDPYSSLNPRMKVRDIIAEPLENFSSDRSAITRRVHEVMEIVKLPVAYADRYPHEFSGGQRQRIGIARAIAIRPRLIVCDEAVSALDVSVQAQILNLLKEIQRETQVALLFISHNLGVVRYLSHRVAVMYLGRVVELASEQALFENPKHPYTSALLSAIPEADYSRRGTRKYLSGDIPSPIDPPPGCPFHQRCEKVQDVCRVETPVLDALAPEHWAACHFPNVSDKGIRDGA
ncbi:ABC transporter ATP-binding protein [Nitratireductor pacificus]|uniref:Oligopeptide/dipeptide ABC transporter ATPase subunit n=1 Tax=Nitratireductor pacificus pht-3B TaxID=391937 RepID=K2LM49_9HYPH|nr:oligopeptide/dipeptide ABC transporter ATP-binding protein [Nitratireductor pacificus]EKF18854.1 oligopeptide/dipeptide ABC transporter ATPase subunit [Nitratireductor pacificus pht-3B]